MPFAEPSATWTVTVAVIDCPGSGAGQVKTSCAVVPLPIGVPLPVQVKVTPPGAVAVQSAVYGSADWSGLHTRVTAIGLGGGVACVGVGVGGGGVVAVMVTVFVRASVFPTASIRVPGAAGFVVLRMCIAAPDSRSGMIVRG